MKQFVWSQWTKTSTSTAITAKSVFIVILSCAYVVLRLVPLLSISHYLSNDDCLEDKREDYQNCSVLRCVRHLCTMIHTHVSSS